MKNYRINEIFYSLQGEGRWAGRAAIFIRFSGCNLKCPFCDTDFESYADMTAREILDTIRQWKPCRFVVLTGGEPTLQVDHDLIKALHDEGFYVAIETNGTHEVLPEIDWITVSPKDWYMNKSVLKVDKADEVKVVMDDKIPDAVFDAFFDMVAANAYYVQPCDTGFLKPNRDIIERCVDYVKRNPQWSLSLQQQKILKVR